MLWICSVETENLAQVHGETRESHIGLPRITVLFLTRMVSYLVRPNHDYRSKSIFIPYDQVSPYLRNVFSYLSFWMEKRWKWSNQDTGSQKTPHTQRFFRSPSLSSASDNWFRFLLKKLEVQLYWRKSWPPITIHSENPQGVKAYPISFWIKSWIAKVKLHHVSPHVLVDFPRWFDKCPRRLFSPIQACTSCLSRLLLPFEAWHSFWSIILSSSPSSSKKNLKGFFSNWIAWAPLFSKSTEIHFPLFSIRIIKIRFASGQKAFVCQK